MSGWKHAQEFEKWARGEIADHPLNMELCQNGCSGLGEHYEDFVTAWAYTAWLSSQQSTLRRARARSREIIQQINEVERANFEGRNLPPTAIEEIIRAAIEWEFRGVEEG